MRVVICGAGQVGSTIARHLAARGDSVTIIDSSAEHAQKIGESHDVRAITGHASYPETLRRAGAQDADMLIAVTRSDDVNMVACQVGYSLFGVKRRIARLRHSGFLKDSARGLFGPDHMPIDVRISPEFEIAESILRRLLTPGAFEMVPFAEGRLALMRIRITDARAPLTGERLADVQAQRKTAPMTVLAATRKERTFAPDADYRVELGDDLYLLAATEDLARLQEDFGHRERLARRIVIAGAGNIGNHLIRRIRTSLPGTDLKVIERNRERAEYIAGKFGGALLVLHGDALASELLEEAQAGTADTIVTVTNDDETNIFATVLAKQAGCKRSIALVEKGAYEKLIPTLGLDSIINPSAITIATLLRHISGRAVVSVHPMAGGFAEVIEAIIAEGAPLVGTTGNETLPEGVRIVALTRGRKITLAVDDTAIEAGDHVLLLVGQNRWPAAEGLLR